MLVDRRRPMRHHERDRIVMAGGRIGKDGIHGVKVNLDIQDYHSLTADAVRTGTPAAVATIALADGA